MYGMLGCLQFLPKEEISLRVASGNYSKVKGTEHIPFMSYNHDIRRIRIISAKQSSIDLLYLFIF